MSSEEVTNRMGEEPDLDGVRASFTKPSLWERTGQRWIRNIRSSTGRMVIMFIAFLVVLGVGAWVLTS